MILFKPFRFALDLCITAIMWVYFIFGFTLFFSPYLAVSVVRYGVKEEVFQRCFHRFFRIFFRLLRILSPTITIRIDPEIKALQSGIVICNHMSYLDPLLMVATFEKQKTIVKSTFFKVPLFSWMIRRSGYVPSASENKNLAVVLRHVGNMSRFLDSGGILFVFPEGTRSRDGKLNPFNKGVFTIARQCNAPVNVLHVKNTNKIFRPGNFLFRTWSKVDIELKMIGRVYPTADKKRDAIEEMMNNSWQLLANQLRQESDDVCYDPQKQI